MDTKLLKNKNFYLRELAPEDVGAEYLSWVNDKEITRFLEIQHQTFDKIALNEFVSECLKSKSKVLWGIFCNKSDKHIGNISITYNINVSIFDGGYFIGNKEYWGTSAGFEALTLMIKYGFDHLSMRRLIAGCYVNNMNARFIFHKIGCQKEARIKEKYLCDGKPVDVVIYSMDQEQWAVAKVKFGI